MRDFEIGDEVEVIAGINDPRHSFPIDTVGKVTKITDGGNIHVERTDVKELPIYQILNPDCLQKINEKEESMTSKYQNFLIELMQVKQSILGPEVKYFTFEDAQELERITDWKAKEIYETITNYEMGREASFLGAHTCPFCTLQEKRGLEGCDGCDYKAIHLHCDNPNSDFQVAKSIERNHKLTYTTEYVVELAKERAGLKEEKAPTGLKHIDNMSEEDLKEQPYIYLTSNGSGTYYEICIEVDHRVTVLGSVTVMNIDSNKAKLRLCDSNITEAD